MDYLRLQMDVIKALRDRSQVHISAKMGYRFNQLHKWETGKTQPSWEDFVLYCQVCEAALSKTLKITFSYVDPVKSTAALVRHFTAGQKRTDVAKEMKVSPSTVSRWMSGKSAPNLPQIFQLMQWGSPDFFRFLEILTKNAPLPSIQEKLETEKSFLALYETYPWLSVLLCGLDHRKYRKSPSLGSLAEVTKLTVKQIKPAIQDLSKLGFLKWNGTHWEAEIGRIGIRSSLESRRKMARYVFSRAQDGVDSAFGKPEVRYSWKIFSLNQKNYDLMLQKYTEFFNSLGQVIDGGNEDADKIYIFAAAFVDFDFLPEDAG